MIHIRKFWQADRIDRGRMYEQFSHVEESDITPTSAYLLGLYTLQELDRVEQIVESLALEEPKASGTRHPRQRKEPVLDVAVTDGQIECLGSRLTPEQARELGTRLIEAANLTEAPEVQ